MAASTLRQIDLAAAPDRDGVALPAFFRLVELAFPFPSSLEVLPDKQPKDGV